MSTSPQLGQQKSVDLSAGTVTYRETGDGPTVVFLHGLIVNGDVWRMVVPQVAPVARCISVDLPLGSHRPALKPDADLSPPGMAALIAEFLEALDLRDVTIVGNDTATGYAQILVTRHPERIGKLVLTPGDAFWNFPPHFGKPLQLLGIVPGALTVASQAARSRLVQRLSYWPLTKRLRDPDIFDSYVSPFLNDGDVRRDLGKVIASIRARYTQEAAERLTSFDKPVLIAWTKTSVVFPRAHAERLANLIPDARLEDIDDSHGFVGEDQPDRVAELVRDFVAA
jgi:pimeloyl-ACP methyl ester carboxylesterase